MKILWDFATVWPTLDGTFFHLKRWLQALDCYPGGHQHHVLGIQAFHDAVGTASLKNLTCTSVGDWHRGFFVRRELFFFKHHRQIEQDYDLLVSLWNPPMVFHGPTLNLVLDGLLLEKGETLRISLRRALRRRVCRHATAQLCTSEFTRHFFADAGFDPSRILVAGIPPPPFRAALPLSNPPPLPYAVFCSAISPRKNHIRVLNAWRKAFPGNELRLVLIGHSAPDIDRSPIGTAIRQACADGIAFHESNIPDARRDALYEKALFTIYPSLFEGFGMPILESLQHGKAVVTSKGTVMEEIGGPAAYYADPTDEDDLAHAFRRLYEDSAFRQQLVSAAPEVLQKYAPRQVAADLCHAAETVLSLARCH